MVNDIERDGVIAVEQIEDNFLTKKSSVITNYEPEPGTPEWDRVHPYESGILKRQEAPEKIEEYNFIRPEVVTCKIEYEDHIIVAETKYSMFESSKKYTSTITLDDEEIKVISHKEPLYQEETTRNKSIRQSLILNLRVDNTKVAADIILENIRKEMSAQKEYIRLLNPEVPLPGEENAKEKLQRLIDQHVTELKSRIDTERAEQEAKPPEIFADCFVPKGHEVRGDGIYELVSKALPSGDTVITPVKICNAKIMITGHFESINKDEGEDVVEVKYFDNTHQGTCLVPQSAICNPPAFRKHLEPKGVRLVNKKTDAFFGYANACIDSNEGFAGTEFKTGKIFYTNGWKDDDCTQFVAGNRLFIDNYGKLKEEECIFRDEINAHLFNEKGSIKAWINGINPILKYPNPRLIMYAAFTAPLLKWLAVDSFAIDIFGGIPGSNSSESSSGKSTAVIIVMSGYGNMEVDENGASLFHSCNNTTVAITNILAMYPDMAVFFDESTFLDKKEREKIAYDVSSPVGKGRGNGSGGIQKQQLKRGVRMITGERPLIEDGQNTGTQIRIQKVRGGIGVPNIADEVDAAKAAAIKNSGFILPLFLDEFYKNRSFVKKWYIEMRDKLTTNVENDLTKRKAAYFAAIFAAGKLMEEVFKRLNIPTMNPEVIVMKIWKDNILVDEIKPLWHHAASNIYDWFNAEMNTSFEVNGDSSKIKKFCGFVTYAKETKEPLLNIFGLRLEEFFKFTGRNYDINSILDSWRDAGLTNVMPSKLKKDGTSGAPERCMNVTRNGSTKRMIQIRLNVLCEMMRMDSIIGNATGLKGLSESIAEEEGVW